MTQTSINPAADIEAAAALPHELGCFETFAELTVEEAAAAGITLEGAHDEIYRGMQIIDRFHQAMAEGTSPCHCVVDPREAARVRALARLAERYAAELAVLVAEELDRA